MEKTVFTYTYEDQTIDYKLVRKKRKTLGIYIDVYGNIEIRVPVKTKQDQIDQLIESKWAWILRHLKEQKEKTKGFKEKTYDATEEMLFLGKHYPMEIIVEDSLETASVQLRSEGFIVRLPEQDEEVIKKLFTRFYKQQCKKLVEQRIHFWQPQFKIKPRKVSIRANKKHWGSCNSNRELTFNWRLAMAPLEVIDYVVVHEMSHMVHMNHDRSFWRLVGSFMPDYGDKIAWLEQSHWKMVV